MSNQLNNFPCTCGHNRYTHPKQHIKLDPYDEVCIAKCGCLEFRSDNLKYLEQIYERQNLR